MILVVGLGNPGKKYEKSRHNIGFRTVDNLQFKIDNFSDWKKEKKLKVEVSQGKINNQEIILAKPQTLMNASGKSVKSLIKTYSFNKAMALLSEYIWVIHDDIDLPLSKIRVVKNRGAAGHKGVESIVRELGTKNFIRFRVGIKPKQSYRLVYRTENFVLEKFAKDEEKIIKEVIDKTVEAIEVAIKEGLERAMNRFNK